MELAKERSTVLELNQHLREELVIWWHGRLGWPHVDHEMRMHAFICAAAEGYGFEQREREVRSWRGR